MRQAAPLVGPEGCDTRQARSAPVHLELALLKWSPRRLVPADHADEADRSPPSLIQLERAREASRLDVPAGGDRRGLWGRGQDEIRPVLDLVHEVRDLAVDGPERRDARRRFERRPDGA